MRDVRREIEFLLSHVLRLLSLVSRLLSLISRLSSLVSLLLTIKNNLYTAVFRLSCTGVVVGDGL